MSRAALAAALALLAVGCGGEEEEPPAAVLRITCTPTALKVHTPRVLRQSDGVHLHAQVRGDVALTIGGKSRNREHLLQLPAGGHRVKCEHGPGSWMGAGFEVVDEGDGAGY